MTLNKDEEDSKYKGIHKHFNSYTNRGRANWGKLMLGFYFLCFVTYKAVRSFTQAKPRDDPLQTVEDTLLLPPQTFEKTLIIPPTPQAAEHPDPPEISPCLHSQDQAPALKPSQTFEKTLVPDPPTIPPSLHSQEQPPALEPPQASLPIKAHKSPNTYPISGEQPRFVPPFPYPPPGYYPPCFLGPRPAPEGSGDPAQAPPFHPPPFYFPCLCYLAYHQPYSGQPPSNYSKPSILPSPPTSHFHSEEDHTSTSPYASPEYNSKEADSQSCVEE